MVSRRLVLISGFALVTAAAPLASARAAGEASAVVTDFGNHMLQMLSNSQLSPADRQKQFGALLDKDFDFASIGRFVLGRYWASATDLEKQEFAPVFRDYVVQSYSVRFGEFSGAAFKVTGERPEGPTSTIVSTTVMQKSNPSPAKVDWRVSTTTGAPKITEVIVEGISMSLTHRQEFASLIERQGGGVAGLIAQLRAKINVARQS
ncbi:MAG TPA: ABC transporter substrate-binding protein [Stellaceae bacterium]|nr:ABC transporter substrate-binding protein [Stellaceae bacterium]